MAENLTHWKKLTNPNYLGSWDITSGSLIVTIKQIEQKMIFNQQKQQEELCTTAIFTDRNIKPMVLNKTNMKTIQTLAGSPYVEKWAGITVEIKAEKVKAFGKVDDALRIQKTKPKTPQVQSQPISAPLYCTDCGQEIKPYGNYSAEFVAESSEKKYGAKLCADCATKRKEAKIDDTNA